MKIPLITVLAHSEASETVARHIPIWLSLEWPIQICVPIEDRDLMPQKYDCRNAIRVFGIGAKGQGGTMAIANRVKSLFSDLAKVEYASHHVILEYDSFFLKPPLLRNGVSGVLFPNAEAPKFTAHLYPNPPWIIDATSLREMSIWFNRFSDICELGHMDRLIPAAADGCGIPLLPYEPYGYSRGTIDLDLDFVTLATSIENGAFAFHGVKDKTTMQFILDTYRSKQEGLSVMPSALVSRQQTK